MGRHYEASFLESRAVFSATIFPVEGPPSDTTTTTPRASGLAPNHGHQGADRLVQSTSSTSVC